MGIFLKSMNFLVLKDRFSKMIFFFWSASFEVNHFRSNWFRKGPFFELIGFKGGHFRTDRCQNDQYSKWSISKSLNVRSGAFSKLLILEVTVFEGFFRRPPFIRNVHFEGDQFQNDLIFELINFNHTRMPNWSIYRSQQFSKWPIT